MYPLILVLFLTLLGSVCRTASVNKHMKMLGNLDNSIEANSIPRRISGPRFLNISQWPAPVTAHRRGRTLALTCEAFAAPAPVIRWFKNDQPLYEHEHESNEIIDSNPDSMGRMTSTILVSHTESQDSYTCVASANQRTVKATTLVYSTNGTTDLTDRTRLVPLKPRIVVSYKVFIDLIGNNVVLPCRAKGHPRPHVTWMDNKGLHVKDPRMKVLRSGELAITPLLWSDMGEFTCQATNTFGTDYIRTFIYPARVSMTNKINT